MTGTRSRIAERFRELKARNRSGLVAFVTAGDPSPSLAQEILDGLPEAGADLIELGVPFSDPMADGPAIQASSRRALRAGQTLTRTLEMVAEFRRKDDTTPIVLFGYYNPLLAYGIDRFARDAHRLGVDGLLVVDLPIEEQADLSAAAASVGLEIILLVAPTTDDSRLRMIAERASGFIYSVAIAGVTGTSSADTATVASQVKRIRECSALPVAVGFGVKTPDQAAAIAREADAAVVGSALVSTIASYVSEDGAVAPDVVPGTLGFVRSLAQAVEASSTEA